MKIIKDIPLSSLHERPFLLDVYFDEQATKRPIVLFAHGFKGFKDWGCWNLMAKHFVQAGFVCLKFNFSHNGTTVDDPMNFGDLEAFGQNNFSKELDDLGVLIDWVFSDTAELPREKIDLESLYLIGHSRGGGAVILKAGEDERVKKISTWAGVPEYGRYWTDDSVSEWKEKGVQFVLNGRTKQSMPLYWQLCEDYRMNKVRLDIPTIVNKLKIPHLIVHGTADRAVDYEAALQLQSWSANAELLTIAEGNHTFGGRHPWEAEDLPADLQQVVQATSAFFQK